MLVKTSYTLLTLKHDRSPQLTRHMFSVWAKFVHVRRHVVLSIHLTAAFFSARQDRSMPRAAMLPIDRSVVFLRTGGRGRRTIRHDTASEKQQARPILWHITCPFDLTLGCRRPARARARGAGTKLAGRRFKEALMALSPALSGTPRLAASMLGRAKGEPTSESLEASRMQA